MNFYVTDSRGTPPPDATYPFVVLITDNWDDYFFKTLFHPVIHLSEHKQVDLRDVKILQFGQQGGRTEIPRSFVQLDDSYCSLGQELAYYESLFELEEDIRIDYLMGLKDAAANRSIREHFEEQDGFKISLLRWGTASLALDNALVVLQGDRKTDYELEFTFHTKFGSNEFGTPFRFGKVKGLPGRINAVIGYNGTGKNPTTGESRMGG